jgi:transcriptional regulator with XRE-family HTH domain
VKAVRQALGLTQEQVGDAAGLGRGEVSKIEAGDNAATSWRIRAGLARAFGVDVQTLSDCIDGLTAVDELLARARSGEKGRSSSIRRLRDRSEWAEVVRTAREVGSMSDPDLASEAWAKVGDLFDNPSIPSPLTPRVMLHLARAVAK